jgi:hypothetical protein
MSQLLLLDYPNLIASISDSPPTPMYVQIGTFALMDSGYADASERFVF